MVRGCPLGMAYYVDVEEDREGLKQAKPDRKVLKFSLPKSLSVVYNTNHNCCLTILSMMVGVYKTPWQGDPRVNIQNKKGKARAYQVRQMLKAIERLELEHDTEG